MNAGNKFSVCSNKHYDEELMMMLVTMQLLIWTPRSDEVEIQCISLWASSWAEYMDDLWM